MIDKFYTIQKLKDTGLKMFGSHIYPDIKIGERFLQPRVISMWDFKNYSDFFTYYDNGIKLVVNLCVRTDEKTIKTEHLKKDLSNLFILMNNELDKMFLNKDGDTPISSLDKIIYKTLTKP